MKAEDFSFDAAFRYNLSTKEKHDCYVGVGGIFNMINGMIIPVGTRFMPLNEFRNLSLQLEGMPVIDFEAFSNLLFFCIIGVRYQFGFK